jgi:hypothetical protein
MLVHLLHMRTFAATIAPIIQSWRGLMSGPSMLRRCGWMMAVAFCLALIPPGARASGESQLEISGLTFIGSRGDGGELVLRATRGLLIPDSEEADLFGVRAEVTHAQGTSFTMSCEKAQLNLETNDFSAEGNVNGVTGGGETYSAPWVRYSEEDDLLYTDAPVSMVNESGRYSGDGFRYQVSQRRFRLIGNVRVEQAP